VAPEARVSTLSELTFEDKLISADSNVNSCLPHAHPELGGPGRLVVSYNVNSFDNTDTYKDVSIYRPRFVDLQFTPPAPGASNG